MQLIRTILQLMVDMVAAYHAHLAFIAEWSQNHGWGICHWLISWRAVSETHSTLFDILLVAVLALLVTIVLKSIYASLKGLLKLLLKVF